MCESPVPNPASAVPWTRERWTAWAHALVASAAPVLPPSSASGPQQQVASAPTSTAVLQPFTEEEVAAAETRLGVTLPPSYRTFLLTVGRMPAGFKVRAWDM